MKFSKIFASRAEDKNVKNYVLYADSNNKLFIDPAKEVKAIASEVKEMFEKNVVVVTDEAEFKPSKLLIEEDVANLIVVDNSGSQGAAAAIVFQSQARA